MYPDFIIRNPFTNETIIWEHFGALHMKEYENAMTNKISNYKAQKFIIDENLICTFEHDVQNIKQLATRIESQIF